MTSSKSTKRALVSSTLAILMCVAMLIGTTFAWFTDSASTAVNKIQAGTLDIQLLDAQDNSIEGQSLAWQKAAGHENDVVLWEPGCTYNLQSFKIKNNGNLALKYKIVISGIVGDAKLLEAIDFTVSGVDGATTTATALNGFEGYLTADSKTDAITISGHMKESAGNEYQGLSIDGIGITVFATQYTYEKDSNGDQYDVNATYPVSNSADLVNAIADATAGSVVSLTSGTFPLPTASIVGEGVTIAGNGAANTVVVTEATGYTLENDNITIKNLTVDGTAASRVNYAGAINLKGNNATIEDSVIRGGGTGTWGASVYVNLGAGETAYIRNTKISGGFRGIFLGSQSGSVVVDECEIDAVYPINVDGGGNFTVSVSNSKLHGWTSYAQITKATFTDTEFSRGASGYDVVAAYTDTTFTNCTFDSSFEVYAQVAGFNFVFNNCTKDGTPVTADNFKTLFPDDSDVWTKCTCTVNGVQVTA